MTPGKIVHGIALGIGAAGIIVMGLPGFGVPSTIVSEATAAVALAGAVLVYVAHGIGVRDAAADALPQAPTPPSA